MLKLTPTTCRGLRGRKIFLVPVKVNKEKERAPHTKSFIENLQKAPCQPGGVGLSVTTQTKTSGGMNKEIALELQLSLFSSLFSWPQYQWYFSCSELEQQM